MTAQQDSGKSWSRIVARAWADDDFKDRLLSDPRAVLREHGIETEGDVRVSVAEDGRAGGTRRHPAPDPPPAAVGPSEEELLPSASRIAAAAAAIVAAGAAAAAADAAAAALCGLCAVP